MRGLFCNNAADSDVLKREEEKCSLQFHATEKIINWANHELIAREFSSSSVMLRIFLLSLERNDDTLLFRFAKKKNIFHLDNAMKETGFKHANEINKNWSWKIEASFPSKKFAINPQIKKKKDHTLIPFYCYVSLIMSEIFTKFPVIWRVREREEEKESMSKTWIPLLHLKYVPTYLHTYIYSNKERDSQMRVSDIAEIYKFLVFPFTHSHTLYSERCWTWPMNLIVCLK